MLIQTRFVNKAFQEADENIEPFKHYYGITEQEELAANKIL
jgi:hypothetical protein